MTPYSKLADNVTIESFERGYVTKVSQLLESKNVLFSTNLSSTNSFIMMPFSLGSYMTFSRIRSFEWLLQLKLFLQLVEIAKLGEKTNTVFLWENENFFIHEEEERVVALLFEFHDYPINHRLTEVEGLKKMIFNSLTTLNYQSGKPKRADFVDQSDRTIDFANKMLLATDIEGVQTAIEETIAEFREQEALETEGKKSGIFKRRTAERIADENYQQLLKRSLLRAQTKGTEVKEQGPRKSIFVRFRDWIFTTKGMIVTGGVVLALSLVSLVVLPAIVNGGNGADSKTVQKNKEVVLKAYQKYITDDKESAYALMDSVGYRNLPSKMDKQILLDFYFEQKKFTKAIQEEPESVYEIGDYLIEADTIDELTKLSELVESDTLKFDVSSLNKEYQQMVLLLPNLKYFNERRSNEGIRAFYLTNQVDEINDFIKSYTKKNEGSENAAIQQSISILTEVNARFAEEYQYYKVIEKEYEDLKSSQASNEELKSKKQTLDNLLKKIEELYISSSQGTGGSEE